MIFKKYEATAKGLRIRPHVPFLTSLPNSLNLFSFCTCAQIKGVAHTLYMILHIIDVQQIVLFIVC